MKEIKVIMSPEVVAYINSYNKVIEGEREWVWGTFMYRRNRGDDPTVYTMLTEIPKYITESTVPQEPEEPKMRLVGTLNSPYGERGFYRCEVGHPVYEKNGRYILIYDSVDGKVIGKEQTFNPEELSKIMDKINSI